MGDPVVLVLVIGLLTVTAGLTVLVFVATRALVRGDRRALSALVLLAGLLVVAAGLAVLFTGPPSLDPRCSSTYPGDRNLERATIVESTGLWPPGLRCRYEFPDGGVDAYRPSFDGVWVAAAMTAVFGAAMGVVTAGRQFSKKGDMLF